MVPLRISSALVFLSANLIFTQTPLAQAPKRELRGAWIATVSKIDWPKSNVPATQRQELTDMLDDLKSGGINAVYLQVRDECDAFYQSSLDPWSFWLTGTQGKAPSPFYDPLAFAVTEAHKRGMELHAWLNPYRAEVAIGAHATATTHVTRLHPDWVLTFTADGMKLLDPGLAEVRNYVTSVVADIVKRYDVDGIHFDDYFYPYSGIANQDAATFNAHSRGITDIGNWRRDNINLLVAQVNDAILKARPHVKFGISPFGIWKSGVPAGISGLSAYSAIYADALAWLDAKTVDYVTPQLYWQFGGGQDYAKLMPWWAEKAGAGNRHLYTGNAAYRIPEWGSSTGIARQVRANRENANCQGNIYFSAASLTRNLSGILDTLKRNLYASKALPPVMAWKDSVPPSAPVNLRYIASAGGKSSLQWDAPTMAADGDSAFFYVVYKSKTAQPAASDLGDARNIRDIVNVRTLDLTAADAGAYFFVTSLDRSANESAPSNAGGSTVSTRLASIPASGFQAKVESQGHLRLSFHGDLPVKIEAVDLQGRLLASLRPRRHEESLRIGIGFRGICTLQIYRADGGRSSLRVGTVLP